MSTITVLLDDGIVGNGDKKLLTFKPRVPFISDDTIIYKSSTGVKLTCTGGVSTTVSLPDGPWEVRGINLVSIPFDVDGDTTLTDAIGTNLDIPPATPVSSITAAVNAYLDAHGVGSGGATNDGVAAFVTASGATRDAVDARVHAVGDASYVPLSGLTEQVQDGVAAFIVGGEGVTITHDDAANTLTIDADGGGGGPITVEDIDASGTPSAATYLRGDGAWATPAGGGGGGVESLADLDVTATAAELNVLDGITATTAELNRIDGVTSPVQPQLDSKARVIRFDDGWPERPDDDVPTEWWGGAMPGDAPEDASAGDVWIPASGDGGADAADAAGVYHVDDYGADPTGVASSAAAVTAALAALGDDPGTIAFGVGTYDIGATTVEVGHRQGVTGVGLGQTILHYTGSGSAVRAHDARSFTNREGWLAGSNGPGQGGPVGPFTVDLDDAGDGAVGLHIGDLFNTDVDVVVKHANGVGSVGALLCNEVTWLERCHARIATIDCTNGIVCDVDGGFDSFGYSDFLFSIDAGPNQNGLALLSGANIYHSTLNLNGNFEAGVSNTGVAVSIGADSTAAKIAASIVKITCETGGSSGVGHQTFNIGSSAFIHQSTGILKFLRVGSVDFEDGNANGRVGFTGVVDVDSNLGRSTFWQGSRTIGFIGSDSGWIDPSSATLYLEGGNIFSTQLVAGAHTFSINDVAAFAGQGIEFDLFLRQPGSGSATVTWPGGWVWPSGVAVLSTSPNAWDHIKVMSPDGSTFFGHHVNA